MVYGREKYLTYTAGIENFYFVKLSCVGTVINNDSNGD